MKIKNEITPTKNSKAKVCIIILLLSSGIVITLKNQALSEEKTQFSLFGHFRTRAEYRNNRDFSSKTPDEIMFINSRLRLGTDFKINENLSAEGIIQDARVWGEAGRKVSDTAPLEGIRFSATNSLGLESLDFISANITAKGKLSEDITISSKIGRQRLAHGEHRIIGTFDWSNVSNSFDGIKLNTKIKNYSFDLFGFLLRENSIQESPTEVPRGVRQKSFFIGNYNILPVPTGSLDLYLLYLRDDVKVNNRPADIFAVGIRKVGEVKLEAINPFWAFEGVYEFGQAWDKKLRAFAISARAGTKIIENKLKIFAEYDVASGTTKNNQEKGIRGTFYNFFPTNHLHYGYADLFSWKNMHGIRGNITSPKFQNFEVSVDVWKFFLFSEHDNWYHAGQAPLLQEKPPYPSKDAGTEIDITLSYNWKNLNISCGYSPFFPGELPKKLGRKDTQQWVFIQSSVDF
jgi:hypothetical protein